ncbi:MAG: aromatic ring-hydroxylating oxygenase subunit alpha [Acidimicrobiales bacterium]|jgi:phenylpropionate dioxygenase-like ring-hydroxylating dioxygenase large terminal subunit
MQHSTQVTILKELMQQLDEGKNIDAGVQVRMPTTSYVCPEIADQEREQFFRNHPQLIGLSGDLPEPGSYLTMDDFGIPILATRAKDGTLHAFLNACRHRSVKVASGERGTKSIFTCPFHMWSYRNTGDLINIPDEDHFGEVDKSCHGLLELPAVERDGLLWVHPSIDGELDIDALLGEELAAELASFGVSEQRYLGEKTIAMDLNWKFANDTFGETYHFQKLHKDTLGRLFLGNNLHLREFGRHQRFVTANHGIHALKDKPEADWRIEDATFVLYHLFPNIQVVVSPASTTLVRIYPDESTPGRSVTKVSFYYANHVVAAFAAAEADERENAVGGLQAAMELFYSSVELEDYVMGEMQQRSAETGMLKEIVFGRNEPALHHFHRNYREALGQPELEIVAG